MRILTLNNHFASGGAAAVAAAYLHYLHQHTQHELEICTLYTLGGMGEPLRDLGIPVHDLARNAALGQSGSGAGKYDPRLIMQLARVIQRGRYDVVHVHTFPASLIAAAAALIARAPAYVFTEHSVNNQRRERALLKSIDRFIYARYDAVIGVSQAVTDALIAYLPAVAPKAHTIPNALDPTRYAYSEAERASVRAELGIAPDHVVALWAGRLEPVKGIDVLIDAVRRIHADQPTLRVLLAGGGSQTDALKQSAADLGDAVRWLGFRADIPRLLAAADVVVLPSRWEGLPMILLEALAAGKPMIASAVGGVPEVITHQVTGWLTPPDDPAALAEALSSLIDSPELRARIGSAGRDHAYAHYSLAACADQLIHVYESVCHASH